MNKVNRSLFDEANPEKWGYLYKIAGYATIIMLIIIPIQIAIFTIFPFPDSIESWFELFNKNWILGLIHLDLFYIINNVIVAIMYLAFYFSLKKKNESLMIIALALGLLGISAYLSSNKAFDIYYVLNGITLIITSCVMFKSSIYSNKIAAIGLFSGVLMMIPSTAGTMGLIFSLASLVPWIVFAILVSIKFLQLSNLK
ncbi:MAG: hypothetical protein PHC44_05840 [Lutispora sp.]|nr:hypothetical protein [Lutispora sp.]MDD4834236.1 hypothetical protein [Lutispora sp.]